MWQTFLVIVPKHGNLQWNQRCVQYIALCYVIDMDKAVFLLREDNRVGVLSRDLLSGCSKSRINAIFLGFNIDLVIE